MSSILKANVTQVTQDSYLDDRGRVLYVTNVKFRVGDHGPFVVTLPREGFTAEAAQKLMQPTVDAINKLSS
jgi:hypothetical protein